MSSGSCRCCGASIKPPGRGACRSLTLNLESLELGLDGDRILMVQIVPPQQDDYANPKRFNANLDRVIEAIAPLPC